MNTKLMLLLSQGETAWINLEKARHAEETARAAVEAAKAALENARNYTSSVGNETQDILLQAETAGLQKKAFRTLIEDRVTALVNSGLFSFEEDTASAPVVVAPRTRKNSSKKAEGENAAVISASEEETVSEATVVAEETAPVIPSAPVPPAASELHPVHHVTEETESLTPDTAVESKSEDVVPFADGTVAEEVSPPFPPAPAKPSFLRKP